jgi:hypothetical protein
VLARRMCFASDVRKTSRMVVEPKDPMSRHLVELTHQRCRAGLCEPAPQA